MLVFVGEGDLKFSYNISRQYIETEIIRNSLSNYILSNITGPIITSTYDDDSELRSKYRDAPIDELDRLGESIIRKTRINAIDIKSYPLNNNTQRVIWNHPHLGIEDAKKHFSLMNHFLNTIRRILKPNGDLMISLLEGQWERWNMDEVIKLQQMKLIVPAFYMPIMGNFLARRNETGRSFTNCDTARKHGINFHNLRSKCYVLMRVEDDCDQKILNELNTLISSCDIEVTTRVTADETHYKNINCNRSKLMEEYLCYVLSEVSSDKCDTTEELISVHQYLETSTTVMENNKLFKIIMEKNLPDHEPEDITRAIHIQLYKYFRDKGVTSCDKHKDISKKMNKKTLRNIENVAKRHDRWTEKLCSGVAYIILTSMTRHFIERSKKSTLGGLECEVCGSGPFVKWQSLVGHIHDHHILNVCKENKKTNLPIQDSKRDVCSVQDWKQNQDGNSCPICTLYPCPESLVPYKPESLICVTCSSNFKDDRALQQHKFHCNNGDIND